MSNGADSEDLYNRIAVEKRTGEGTMDRRAHWDHIYATRASNEVSWFQSEPTVSLRLLQSSGLTVAT